jgi:hypothetical protein
MPRKKPVGPEHLLEAPPLMLPPVRTHKHEREADAYEQPPGSVPVTGRVTRERIVRQEPLKRSLTKEEKAQRSQITQEQKFLADRYHRYLDLMAEFSGRMDYREQALAVLFDITPQEAGQHLFDLIAEVHRGRGSSDVTRTLERNDLDRTARISVARKWVYSDNPAASINALKLLEDWDGSTDQTGTFEQFLRTHKLSKGIA